MKRTVTLVLVLLIAAACGDDSRRESTAVAESTTSTRMETTTSTVMDDAAFVQSVGRVCDERFETKMQQSEEELGARQNRDALARLIRERYIPTVRETLDELGKLSAPEDLRADYAALLKAGRKGLADFETLYAENPSFMEADEHPQPFEAFSSKAEAFGLEDHRAF